LTREVQNVSTDVRFKMFIDVRFIASHTLRFIEQKHTTFNAFKVRDPQKA